MKNPPLFSRLRVRSRAWATRSAACRICCSATGCPDATYRRRCPRRVRSTGTFRAVDVNVKSTRYQQFNVNLEKEFAGNVATVGYVGSRRRLRVGGNNQNLDLAPIGPGARAGAPHLRADAAGPDHDQLLHDATTSRRYHALQLIFQRRFRERAVGDHALHAVGGEEQRAAPVGHDRSGDARVHAKSGRTRPTTCHTRGSRRSTTRCRSGRDLTGVTVACSPAGR